MRLIILLILSLTYCHGRSGSHHAPSCTCPTNNTLIVEAIKDLRVEFDRLKKQLGELSANPKPTVYLSSCAEVNPTTHKSGIYNIKLNSYSEEPFKAMCDADIDGGGWTVIQRRMDGSVDFFRDWNSYKDGFGNLETEFFIGLDKLHALTNLKKPKSQHELWIIMQDFENVTRYAKYSEFVIGSELEDYALKKLGTYKGDAGDSLTFQIGEKFSTKDRNVGKLKNQSCADFFKGAWWFKEFCGYGSANLNGKYMAGEAERMHAIHGITWPTWHGLYYSLKDVKMMIRPKDK